MRKFKHFDRQLALFGPIPVIGVELKAQFCDAFTEFTSSLRIALSSVIVFQ